MNRVKQIRESHGLTQQQIADRLGISKSSYNLKENGGRKFDLHEAYELSKIFKKSIENIFFS